MLAGRTITRQLASAVVGHNKQLAATTTTTATSRSLFTSTAVCSRRQQQDQQKQQQQQQQTKTSSESMLQAKTSQTLPAAAPTQPDELQEIRPNRPLFYHDQMEWLDERQVRISQPSKNVMQSGTAATKCWQIEFDSQPRFEYWLMGWAGTSDPMSNTQLTFPSKETAIAFCERNQLHWIVEEKPERKIRKKSYAENFSWDKRTRLGSK